MPADLPGDPVTSPTEIAHAPADLITLGARRYAAVCTCGKRYRGGTRAAARAELAAHIARHTPNPCPTPGKTAFDTPEAAQAALGRAWRRQRPGRRPTRAYRCPGCGAWHLTAKPDRGGLER